MGKGHRLRWSLQHPVLLSALTHKSCSCSRRQRGEQADSPLAYVLRPDVPVPVNRGRTKEGAHVILWQAIICWWSRLCGPSVTWSGRRWPQAHACRWSSSSPRSMVSLPYVPGARYKPFNSIKSEKGLSKRPLSQFLFLPFVQSARTQKSTAVGAHQNRVMSSQAQTFE